MQQPQKRQKISDELNLEDLAASIESLAGTMKNIGQVYGYLLTMNKAIVNYYQEVNKLETANSKTSGENIEVDGH